MANEAETLADFINAWLRLKREDKTIDHLYQYWILGGGAQPRQPRCPRLDRLMGHGYCWRALVPLFIFLLNAEGRLLTALIRKVPFPDEQINHK
jgi:hypothetical protein